MWNTPTKKQLAKIPKLYSTESIPIQQKKVYMHFFVGGADWWVTEYNPEERLFFGFVNLGDPNFAEWGYFSLDELTNIRIRNVLHVDRDLHWKVRPVSEVKGIQACSLGRI